jgi:hypothetical protein
MSKPFIDSAKTLNIMLEFLLKQCGDSEPEMYVASTYAEMVKATGEFLEALGSMKLVTQQGQKVN